MIYELEKMNTNDVYSITLSVTEGYLYYHESKYYQSVVDKVYEIMGFKHLEAVRCFVSNAARATNVEHTKGFRIFLDKNVYLKNKYKIGYKSMMAVLKVLEEKSFIHIYKGFVKHWKIVGGKRLPEVSIKSCIILRKRWYDMWDTSEGTGVKYNLWKEVEEESLVVVKDRKTKEVKSLRGVRGVKQIKGHMVEFKGHMKNADIRFNGEKIANVVYRRSFSDNLFTGGRYYAVGGGVQLLPQKLRSSLLTFGDEPVVELDYSSIHPNIAYQLLLINEGLNAYDVYPEGFKPYGADLSFLCVNLALKSQWEERTGKVHDPVRAIAKLALLIGMNSSDKSEASSGLASKVHEDRKRVEIEDQDFYAIDGTIPCADIVEAVCEHNYLIKPWFFSDSGMALQYKDSQIMEYIVQTMIQEGEPLLCYHDSVIVRVSKEDLLRKTMFDAWNHVLGDTTFCKVDKK